MRALELAARLVELAEERGDVECFFEGNDCQACKINGAEFDYFDEEIKVG